MPTFFFFLPSPLLKSNNYNLCQKNIIEMFLLSVWILINVFYLIKFLFLFVLQEYVDRQQLKINILLVSNKVYKLQKFKHLCIDSSFIISSGIYHRITDFDNI